MTENLPGFDGGELDDRSDIEPIDDQTLAELYLETAAWLVANSGYRIDRGTKTYGSVEGVPVLDGPAWFEAVVPGEVLAEATPDAARTLRTGRELALLYYEPYYEYQANDPPVYVPPHVVVKVEHDPTSEPAVAATRFDIRLEAGQPGGYGSDRTVDYPAVPGEPERDIWFEYTGDPADMWSVYGRPSIGEHTALQEVLRSLDGWRTAGRLRLDQSGDRPDGGGQPGDI